MRGISEELRGGMSWSANKPSLLRYACDVILYRVLRLVRVNGDRHERTIQIAGQGPFVYRLDRGDIRVLAETLTLQAYRLPIDTAARTIVDLGSHIGAASVWMAHRYGARRVLAVEPSPANARLTRLNLALNRISATVIEAAIADHDGWVSFDCSPRNSTLGQIADAGVLRVAAVTMPTVLAELESREPIDLLKVDIEGAEAVLFAGDLRWLDRVGMIIAELHPNLIDVEPIVSALRQRGFSYQRLDVHPAGWLFGDLMAVFERRR